MNKKSYTYRLYDNTNEYIEKIAAEKNLNKTDALDLIIKEHMKGTKDFADTLAETLVKKIDEKYSNALTRIRLASTFADEGTQVTLEMLNTICSALEIERYFSTTLNPTEIYTKSSKEVKNRISILKQRKDNAPKKKGNDD